MHLPDEAKVKLISFVEFWMGFILAQILAYLNVNIGDIL